ncbi:MAG: hypothetical protein R3B07_13505 [Polyangiaceae bacterium]
MLLASCVWLAQGCSSGPKDASTGKDSCADVKLAPCPPACEASADELSGQPCPGPITRMMVVSCATETHFCSCQGTWYCFEPEPKSDDCDQICR